MGPLFVEDADELIETALLLQEVLGSWLGGFLLERSTSVISVGHAKYASLRCQYIDQPAPKRA